MKDKPLFSEDVPESERLSREKLIALADGYFSTIQQNTGKIYTSFDPDCQRVENGRNHCEQSQRPRIRRQDGM